MKRLKRTFEVLSQRRVVINDQFHGWSCLECFWVTRRVRHGHPKGKFVGGRESKAASEMEDEGEVKRESANTEARGRGEGEVGRWAFGRRL